MCVHKTLRLALELVGMYAVAVSKWAVSKLSLFAIWSISFRCFQNFFLTFTLYRFLKSLLVSEDKLLGKNLNGPYCCVDSGESLKRRFSDLKILLQKRIMPHSSKDYLYNSCKWMYNLPVFLSSLGRWKSIFSLLVFRILSFVMQACSRVKNLPDILHFYLARYVSRIYYFRLYL